MNEKYELAARLTVNMVTEILSKRHGWLLNEALSRLSKTRVYDLLADYKTELWIDNPSDIADMFDLEYEGKKLPPDIYFK
jgi:hypothetical protein